MQFDLVQSPARFDGWSVHITKLHGVCGEVFDFPTRTVLVDATKRGPKLTVAHALAHLALRHQFLEVEFFPEALCDVADEHAQSLLGFDGSFAELQTA